MDRALHQKQILVIHKKFYGAHHYLASLQSGHAHKTRPKQGTTPPGGKVWGAAGDKPDAPQAMARPRVFGPPPCWRSRNTGDNASSTPQVTLMGKRGPRPTPTEILAASGSWRASARTRAGEPRAPSLAPAPPDEFQDQPSLLEAWHTICERIAAIQTLSHVDAASIERYCHLSVRYARANAHIMANGVTYPILTKEGEVKYYATFPQVAEANSCAAQMLKLEHEFGLTPASRVGLSSTVQQGNANTDAEDEALLD